MAETSEVRGRVLWRGPTVEPVVPADVERPTSIVRAGFLFVPAGSRVAIVLEDPQEETHG